MIKNRLEDRSLIARKNILHPISFENVDKPTAKSGETVKI